MEGWLMTLGLPHQKRRHLFLWRSWMWGLLLRPNAQRFSKIREVEWCGYSRCWIFGRQKQDFWTFPNPLLNDPKSGADLYLVSCLFFETSIRDLILTLRNERWWKIDDGTLISIRALFWCVAEGLLFRCVGACRLVGHDVMGPSK